MKTVSNTTPIISLASIGKLHILEKLFKEIIIPEAVYIDENIGYKIAKNSGLNAIRTLSILLNAKEKNIIKATKPLLDEMMLKGRWYSKKVYTYFLKRAKEID